MINTLWDSVLNIHDLENAPWEESASHGTANL